MASLALNMLQIVAVSCLQCLKPVVQRHRHSVHCLGHDPQLTFADVKHRATVFYGFQSTQQLHKWATYMKESPYTDM